MHADLKIWPATAYYWYGFNVTAEPFDDVNFRKAVALSIDYPKAIEDCLAELKKAGAIQDESELSAVGFKVVLAKDVTG